MYRVDRCVHPLAGLRQVVGLLRADSSTSPGNPLYGCAAVVRTGWGSERSLSSPPPTRPTPSPAWPRRSAVTVRCCGQFRDWFRDALIGSLSGDLQADGRDCAVVSVTGPLIALLLITTATGLWRSTRASIAFAARLVDIRSVAGRSADCCGRHADFSLIGDPRLGQTPIRRAAPTPQYTSPGLRPPLG